MKKHFDRSPLKVKQVIRDAQDNMMKVAKESSTLLDAAKKRAQMLIESYVHQMDEMAGTKHTVIWKDVA